MRNAILDALLAIAFVLLLMSDVKAESWTRADTMLELSYVAVALADAMTTADIRNHDDIEEQGVLARAALGANPNPGPTAAYFAGAMAIHYSISRALPRDYRRVWQMVTVAVNGGIVANNISLGLKVGF